MSDTRRAPVILIQRGDPQITGAIAEGMLEGRKSRQLPPEQMEIVKAEIDRQRVARLVRVAVGNDNTPEDYQCMIVKARHDYRKYYRRPGPLRRLGGALLSAYALIVCGLSRAYRAQERILGGE